MIGQTISHYRILEKLGEGGMGEVYRARDDRLARDVALKVLPPEVASSPERVARFELEARAVAGLNHPNIVTLYSIEEDQGVHFLTMELVDGQTLNQILVPGGLPVPRVVDLLIPLCEALVAAHENGIVHRDLKPTNVMVTREGRVKVLDFGLAKLSDPGPSGSDKTLVPPKALTIAGGIVGTPSYMSPEQAAGRAVDHRSDLFSLGIMLYELLCGEPPFRGDYPVAVMFAVMNEPPAPLLGVPESVRAIVDRCLQKDPKDRFAKAEELLRALRQSGSVEDMRSLGPTIDVDPEARQAFDRQDWNEAYRVLRSLAEKRSLSAQELEMLAHSAAWISEFEQYFSALEKAHAMYAERGDHISAARVALGLVSAHAEWEASAHARGWIKRAERHLRDQPECREHARLYRRKTADALAACDLEAAAEWNRQCMTVADRVGDDELRTEALHDQGRILILQGEIDEGRDLIDEAMAAAVSGAVPAMTLGNLYCRTLTVCSSIADFGRAREWTEAAWRWCGPYQASGFPGMCRVHGAETMRHQGNWNEAESMVRMACDWFAKLGPRSQVGAAFHELGELLLRKGDLPGAEDAFRRAHDFGRDPLPGLPLLRLAQDRRDEAHQVIERALAESPDDRLYRAKLLSALIVIALAVGDVARAEAAVDELSAISRDYRCPAFQAQASLGRGAVSLDCGDPAAATVALREAWQAFHRAGFTYDAARSRTLLARAYLKTGNAADARIELEAAFRAFTELGARADLEQVSTLISSLE